MGDALHRELRALLAAQRLGIATPVDLARLVVVRSHLDVVPTQATPAWDARRQLRDLLCAARAPGATSEDWKRVAACRTQIAETKTLKDVVPAKPAVAAAAPPARVEKPAPPRLVSTPSPTRPIVAAAHLRVVQKPKPSLDDAIARAKAKIAAEAEEHVRIMRSNRARFEGRRREAEKVRATLVTCPLYVAMPDEPIAVGGLFRGLPPMPAPTPGYRSADRERTVSRRWRGAWGDPTPILPIAMGRP